MARLTEAEKAANKRQKMIEKASEMASGTYCRKFVAPLFQRMIRAESAALHAEYGYAEAIVSGELEFVFHRAGECVCVTCGKVYPWSGTNMMDTGHFISSRRNSILLLEKNCAPQCKHCNRDHHGKPLEFRQWMLAVRGQEVIDRLQRLKTESVTFTREELVDMRIEFNRRLKAAVESMKGNT